MASLNNVVVTEITNKNINQLWPEILSHIKSASFIAIDAEMSGLGPRSGTMNPNIDDRFKALSAAATSHSLISLGVACFKTVALKSGEGICSNVEYAVSIYNFILLCCEPYTIDPNAVRFLIEHGFDFNKQFSCGMSYHKGNDKTNTDLTKPSIRSFICEVIRQRKPLVLHNGFTDLVFMYQNLYANCPNKLSTFMADISEMFPMGLYDTKYIAEFCDHLSASYLQYVFKIACIKNETLQDSGKVFMQVSFDADSEWSVTISTKNPIDTQKDKTSKICMKYAAYGWCTKGSDCTESHDTDRIIEFHMQHKPNRKRKRGAKKPSGDCQKEHEAKMETSNVDIAVENDEKEKTKSSELKANQGHRSGFDAFMTGYAFAMFIMSNIIDTSDKNPVDNAKDTFSSRIPFLGDVAQKSVKNKLYLSGKSIPLTVCKSSFAKASKDHTEKLIRVYIN